MSAIGLRTAPDTPAVLPFLQAGVAPLRALLRATRVVFIERDEHAAEATARPPAGIHFIDWPPGSAARYRQAHWQRDPIRHWLADAEQGKQGDVALLSDLVPAWQLRRAAYYADIMAPADVQHVLSVALRAEGRITAVLSLLRPAAAGDFGSAERALAGALAPLLTLAYQGARAQAAAPALATLNTLTARERAVAEQVLAGLANKQIARLHATSPATVKNQLRAVYRKLGVATRTELCARYGNRAINASAACSPDP